jgi:uncharacterized protein (TIGR02118 family)
MIRLTFLLRRKPGTTLEDFQTDWRARHGPLVASLATTLRIRRYIQSHTLDDELAAAMRKARGGMEAPYDGVADVWWESEAALAQAAASEAGQRAAQALLDDEMRIIDGPRSPMWLAHEHPQINPACESLVARPRSGLVKLVFPLRMRAELGSEAGRLDWRTQHGPLIRSQAMASGILRYVQVHRFASELEPGFRASRGVVVDAYDGHAELWFDRARLSVASPVGAEAARRAVQDERRFIDFDRSSIWLAHEHVLVDDAPG